MPPKEDKSSFSKTLTNTLRRIRPHSSNTSHSDTSSSASSFFHAAVIQDEETIKTATNLIIHYQPLVQDYQKHYKNIENNIQKKIDVALDVNLKARHTAKADMLNSIGLPQDEDIKLENFEAMINIVNAAKGQLAEKTKLVKTQQEKINPQQVDKSAVFTSHHEEINELVEKFTKQTNQIREGKLTQERLDKLHARVDSLVKSTNQWTQSIPSPDKLQAHFNAEKEQAILEGMMEAIELISTLIASSINLTIKTEMQITLEIKRTDLHKTVVNEDSTAEKKSFIEKKIKSTDLHKTIVHEDSTAEKNSFIKKMQEAVIQIRQAITQSKTLIAPPRSPEINIGNYENILSQLKEIEAQIIAPFSTEHVSTQSTAASSSPSNSSDQSHEEKPAKTAEKPEEDYSNYELLGGGTISAAAIKQQKEAPNKVFEKPKTVAVKPTSNTPASQKKEGDYEDIDGTYDAPKSIAPANITPVAPQAIYGASTYQTLPGLLRKQTKKPTVPDYEEIDDTAKVKVAGNTQVLPPALPRPRSEKPATELRQGSVAARAAAFANSAATPPQSTVSNKTTFKN